FSFYDQVLDTVALLGAVPDRYRPSGETVDLDTYFAMARGAQTDELDVQAMEMTKWFDTNYHYIVPELDPNQSFELAWEKPVDEYEEAEELGIETRPVLLGPVSFLQLSKTTAEGASTLDLLDDLLEPYGELLAKLEEAGADAVQIEEPCLVTDQTADQQAAYETAYEALDSAIDDLSITLTTYFGELRENLDLAFDLPVDGVHLDLCRGDELD
ncbi:MAG: 5-methyltetrahydropteroyltriglutamate--homocysteine S-methyltransferase, partial [Bradymonadaceae bacterium]